MKKLLALSTAIFLTPLTALAISLSDIENNPDEYVLVGKNAKVNLYVDSYSIASLRYDPPYYAMSSDIYMVMYSINSILKTNLTATYDYNRCFKSLFIDEYKSHPNSKNSYIIGLTLHDLEEDNGLTSYLGDADIWGMNGNYIYSLTGSELSTLILVESDSLDTDVTRCPLGSPVYHAANYMFYKGYNEYFGPKFDSQDLY